MSTNLIISQSAIKISGKNTVVPKKLSYDEFKRMFRFNGVDFSAVHEAMDTYVVKRKLLAEDWRVLVEPVKYLLERLDNNSSLFYKLLYAICDERLVLMSNYGKKKGSRKREIKRVISDDKKKDLSKLKICLDKLISHLESCVPYMTRSDRDDDNPLSGSSQKQLLDTLKKYSQAWIEIEELKKKDGGRSALYQWKQQERIYAKRGTTITDHVTRFILYFEYFQRMSQGEMSPKVLSNITILFRFLKLDGPVGTLDIKQMLKDRLRKYENRKIGVFKTGWKVELIPPIYTY